MRITTYHAGVAVLKGRKMISEAIKKLAAYEDTGLTPEQIYILQNDYISKCDKKIEKQEKTCKTCMNNDCGLCDSKGLWVEDDDACRNWQQNETWKDRVMHHFTDGE